MVQKWKQLPLFMMTAKQNQMGTRQNGTGCELMYPNLYLCKVSPY